MDTTQQIESVTIPEIKKKNPKSIEWGKKLGAMKGKKTKPEGMSYSSVYIPLLVIAVGISGYVIWTLRNIEKPKQITHVPKEKKMNFSSF